MYYSVFSSCLRGTYMKCSLNINLIDKNNLTHVLESNSRNLSTMFNKSSIQTIMLRKKVQHKKTLKLFSQPLANMRLGMIQIPVSITDCKKNSI